MLASLFALASGCGDERRVQPELLPDGGPLIFDAAMISPPDGGVRDLGRDGGSGLPPAVMRPQGVLTPYPGLRFDVLPTDLRVVTANFNLQSSIFNLQSSR